MSQDQENKILKQLTDISELHARVIFGDDKIGFKGLIQRQDEDEKAKKEFLTEIKAIHSDVDIIMQWKGGIQKAFSRVYTWKFWATAMVVGMVCYTIISKGGTELWDLCKSLIKLI